MRSAARPRLWSAAIGWALPLALISLYALDKALELQLDTDTPVGAAIVLGVFCLIRAWYHVARGARGAWLGHAAGGALVHGAFILAAVLSPDEGNEPPPDPAPVTGHAPPVADAAGDGQGGDGQGGDAPGDPPASPGGSARRSGPGWRIRKGAYESLAGAFRLRPAEGWRLLVGDQLAKVEALGEAGIFHADPEILLRVDGRRASDVSLAAYQREQVATMTGDYDLQALLAGFDFRKAPGPVVREPGRLRDARFGFDLDVSALHMEVVEEPRLAGSRGFGTMVRAGDGRRGIVVSASSTMNDLDDGVFEAQRKAFAGALPGAIRETRTIEQVRLAGLASRTYHWTSPQACWALTLARRGRMLYVVSVWQEPPGPAAVEDQLRSAFHLIE